VLSLSNIDIEAISKRQLLEHAAAWTLAAARGEAVLATVFKIKLGTNCARYS